MAPFAICSGEKCPFVFDYREDVAEMGQSTPLPPEYCPICGLLVIYSCHSCFVSLAAHDSKICSRCGKDIRAGMLKSYLGSIIPIPE